MVGKPCRCDSKPCASGCPCFKAKILCTEACHNKVPWVNVPCLNTDAGLKVKSLKPVEVRKALCDAGLSPVGDKPELQKRLAVHYFTLADKATNVDAGNNDQAPKGQDTEELMNVIMANEGDFEFILCLSGKMVKATSSKSELRKAYFILSSKVHPDKNPGSLAAKKAFQAVSESFERLANPEKFEEEEDDDDDKPAKKRQKTERFTRGNSGCHVTKIKCPRCNDIWNTQNLGLEDAAYNFLMLGIKQYLCGGCFLRFGCMTAIHSCPHCRKSFEYDPDDYHRQITCGNKKCDSRTFGFWMFKVSERREMEIRREVKVENEALAKKRAQQKRRGARANKRVGTQTNEERVKEQLFLLKLSDTCPRCGWFLERHLKKEDAKEHLDNCTDQKAIKIYQKSVAEKQLLTNKKEKAIESQEEMMAFKTWEINGRQVGQLWMLSENILLRECKKYELETHGPKHVLIARLGDCIRSRERKMITMGGEGQRASHDITPIHKVDSEDLPQNWESMPTEDLQCIAASYGLDFDHSKDVKIDLLKKLDTARLKGSGLLMILDDQAGTKRKKPQQKEDPDYQDGGDGGDSE